MDKLVKILFISAIALIVTDCKASVVEFDIENHSQLQTGQPGKAIKGSYSWVSPEDYAFLVKYSADNGGYRVLESNAVPINADGVAADGLQAAKPAE